MTISDEDKFQLDIAGAIKAMGLVIQSRGQDATGVAIMSQSGHIRIVKDPVPADKFFADHRNLGMAARMAIIHTRAHTQGSPTNPLNNHPIEYDSIVGIHNGILMNDDDVFAHHKWERKAQVDSEAVFAALHHMDSITDALETVDGSYALAWFNRDEPNELFLARGSSSPLLFGRSKGGSFFFGSTEATVIAGMIAAGLSMPDDSKPSDFTTLVREGMMFSVDARTGVQTDYIPFDEDGTKAVWTGARKSRTYWWDRHDFTTHSKTNQRSIDEFMRRPLKDDPIDALAESLEYGDPLEGDDLMCGDVLEIEVGGESMIGEVIGIGADDGEVYIDFGTCRIDLNKVHYRIMNGV